VSLVLGQYERRVAEASEQTAAAAGRIATALERIANVLEGADAAVSQPPAQPEVGRVRIAED
jgi:hypothetical protein